MERTYWKIKITKDWAKDLINTKLEKSIDWNIAIVKKINKFSADIETQDGLKGVIEYKDITWTKKNLMNY